MCFCIPEPTLPSSNVKSAVQAQGSFWTPPCSCYLWIPGLLVPKLSNNVGVLNYRIYSYVQVQAIKFKILLLVSQKMHEKEYSVPYVFQIIN